MRRRTRRQKAEGGRQERQGPCNPLGRPVCAACGFVEGVNCLCHIDIHAQQTERQNVPIIDRIPKRERYDPQLGKSFEGRSEIKRHVAEHNARLGEGGNRLRIA